MYQLTPGPYDSLLYFFSHCIPFPICTLVYISFSVCSLAHPVTFLKYSLYLGKAVSVLYKLMTTELTVSVFRVTALQNWTL